MSLSFLTPEMWQLILAALGYVLAYFIHGRTPTDPTVTRFPVLKDLAQLMAEHDAQKKADDARQLLVDLAARFGNSSAAAPKA